MSAYLQALLHRAFLFQARRRTGAYRLATFGRDSVIVPPAKILAPHRIEIGERVLIFENANFSLVEEYRGRRYQPRLRIGEGTIIGHTVWFSCVGEIEIGANVLIGHNVLIGDSFHEYANRAKPILHQPMANPRPVHVGAGACVGPGAAILSGTTIGAGSYIVANAVVVGDIEPHSVVAGNPGEVIRRWEPGRGAWVDSADPCWSALLSALTAKP